ncbi:hypothetical protein EYF80_038651 [Liparis tanakae]|uniref:Uncharacterized protein n=1 Tax=Liparis tanakae TaxID=230148 RepID=A0A4Z2GCZ5_9TELE|nr:hypothetical protein EYF80_038651 [Liparis tanakae]
MPGNPSQSHGEARLTDGRLPSPPNTRASASTVHRGRDREAYRRSEAEGERWELPSGSGGHREPTPGFILAHSFVRLWEGKLFE